MKLVIFGASGATGKQLVSQALGQGHEVTAFVRNPAKLSLSHPRLRIVQGDVGNHRQVEAAVQNQHAVLSALGVSKPLQHDPAVVRGIGYIVGAMAQAGVPRLVYQSTFLVAQHRAELGFLVHKVLPVILRREIADHERKEELVRASPLEYVIVRPSTLTNGPTTGTYRHGERILPSSLVSPISRANVAAFMLRQLSDDTYLHKAPRVMK